MHAKVVEVGRCWALVLNSGKSRQTIIVYVYAQWGNTIHQHIDPEIKFVAIYKIWFMHVALHDHMLHHAAGRSMDRLLSSDRLWITRQEDSFALTASLRLHYECLVALLGHLGEELLDIEGQVVSWREEVIVIGEDGLEPHQMAT